MKIKSSFKDYYDYIAYSYGGGDPKWFYNRNRLVERVNLGSLQYDPGVFVDFEFDRDIVLNNDRIFPGWEFKYIAIVGKWYLVLRKIQSDISQPENKWEILNRITHNDVVSKLFKRWRWRKTQSETFEFYIGYEDKQLIMLSKYINTPVFTIENYSLVQNAKGYKKYKVRISGDVPILANYGIPSVYPAEQIYQDIAYFIANKMHDSPDLQPPIQNTNKDKIIAHGFDFKRSFRPKMK